MKLKEKAEFIVHELDKLYPKPPVPLSHKDPYTLLVAVLLSAQCTDDRVNKTTPELFSIADQPRKMARLSAEEIEGIVRPCGLAPSKSKNIKRLSEILEEKYNGKVPETIEELEQLPGVGHKTASVVAAQAFGVPAFPVDTHIHRLMYRWGLSTGKNVKKTEEDAKRIFDKSIWNKLHIQIILYGREYSPARGFRPEKDFITAKVGRKSFLKKHGYI